MNADPMTMNTCMLRIWLNAGKCDDQDWWMKLMITEESQTFVMKILLALSRGAIFRQ